MVAWWSASDSTNPGGVPPTPPYLSLKKAYIREDSDCLAGILRRMPDIEEIPQARNSQFNMKGSCITLFLFIKSDLKTIFIPMVQ